MLTDYGDEYTMPYMTKDHYYNTKLKDARTARKLSMQNVADELGVDRQTVFRAEAGKSAGYELLVQMCGLYEIPMNEIVVPKPEAAAA